MGKRTDTSFVILGLLALGPKTPYELVQGYQNSIGQVSHRAPSVLYAEPKRLLTDGLVTGSKLTRGRRTVTRYEITDQGLAVLQDWLAETPTFPTVEADPIVRTMFSDTASPDMLRDTIEAFRTETQTRLDVLASIGQDYSGEDLPAERLHLAVLSNRFVGFVLRAYLQWCDWALSGFDQWTDDEARQRWIRQVSAEWKGLTAPGSST